MLTAEEMTERIGKREAAVLRDKMHPDQAVTAAAIDPLPAMSARIAQREAALTASAATYTKTQERLREVRGF